MTPEPERRRYRGYTYPKVLSGKLAHWFWRWLFCPSGFHLFDEVFTGEEHYLHCDECGVDFPGCWNIVFPKESVEK